MMKSFFGGGGGGGGVSSSATITVLLAFLAIGVLPPSFSNAFVVVASSVRPRTTTSPTTTSSTTALAAATNTKCTPLPAGLSPFTKSESKSLDLQGTFRKLAAVALQRAVKDSTSSNGAGARATCFEVEFPPLAGGDSSKSQFDDFDNVSELNANADFCVQWAPMVESALNFNKKGNDDSIWLVFPDDKECELAKKEWTGQRYRQAAKFTSIRAAVAAVTDAAAASASGSGSGDQKEEKTQLVKAWGSSFAEAVDKLQGGDGILADSSTLDDLNINTDGDGKRLNIVCQPGNGGPVEDWINVQTLHQASSNGNVYTCIVNGALDKVRDGYYPGIFFPALAKASSSFYQRPDQLQTAFYLKPITDKGLYGWIFHVYGEPWQVILQTVTQKQSGKNMRTEVVETTALLSDTRPTYQEAVQALVKTAVEISSSKQ